MDRKIKKKRFTPRRILTFGIGTAVAFLLLSLVLSTDGSTYIVAKDKVTLGVVSQGPFQDVIPVTGNIRPLRTLHLDAIEGGRVEEVFVEEGAIVEKDQPLLRLSNTALMLDFMNRETQIIEQINNLRTTRITMEMNEREINTQLLDISYQMDLMERQFTIDTALYKAEVIATKDYEDSKANYHYLSKKKNLLETSNHKDSIHRHQQLHRIDRSIDLMERNLFAIRKNLENLTVSAPISGQLTAFNPEIGENKSKGENLGRIDLLSGYFVRAAVDEHYITRVQVGQKGLFTLSGKDFVLNVTKVLPEVSNGQFEVEMEFSDAIPNNVHRGQSLQVKLELSQEVEALLIPRGGFYNSSGGSWIFVIEDGKASKRSVRLGRQNQKHLEGLEGLVVGEKVLVSSYAGFEDVEHVILEETQH